MSVQKSRFILLSIGGSDEGPDPAITWILVSSNNRPLGRGAARYATSEDCRAAVLHLRRNQTRVTSSAMPAEPSGHWGWRVDVDNKAVAVSTRTYLRHRECDYNLQRFLEAVRSAEVADTIRVVRSGRRR